MFLTIALLVGNFPESVQASSIAVSGNETAEELPEEESGSSSEETEEESGNEGGQVSGNETDGDAVSGNQPQEDGESVSNNQTVSGGVSANSVSANTLSMNALDESFQEKLAVAKEKLSELLQNKVVMALVYLKDYYEVKKEPDHASGTVAVIPSGRQVHIMDIEYAGNSFWYLVSFTDKDLSYSGYIEKTYLAYSDEEFMAWENKYLPLLNLPSTQSVGSIESDADVKQFPDSYRSNLYQLKAAHPNWKFVKMNTNLDWNTVVKNELNISDRSRSLVPSDSPASWIYGKYNSKWSYASEEILKYYLDPRNFITDTHMFSFEQLTYNASYHTQAGVQTFLQGSFMKGSIPGEGMTYAQAFWEIGNKLGVSPYHLASRVYQEQGKNGTSPMISGTYPGYEGYYNYFNIGATESTNQSEIIKSGLETAKKNGWDSRYKSLEGGARTIAKDYILCGQDTLYLQKFDVEDEYKGLYWHQYMQNIMAPSSEAVSIRKSYANAGSLENTFVFKVPVYNNMPSEACRREDSQNLTLSITTLTLEKGGDYRLSASLNGVPLDNGEITWSSSDKEVATVDKEGLVTAIKGGSSYITAKAKGSSAVCKVDVPVPLTGITLDSKVKLKLGKTQVLTLTMEPLDTTEAEEVKWSSSDKNIAEVSEDGTVTAIAYGNAVITAAVGKFKAECAVEVVSSITKVVLAPSQLRLYQGSSDKLVVTYEPFYLDEDEEILWSSSNEEVATVKDGRVYAHKPGEAVIKVSITNAFATATVTVEACQVSFLDENGETSQKADYAYGDMMGELPQPEVREGYRFIGWFSGQNGTGTRYTENTQVRNSLSLYPYWLEISGDFQIDSIGDLEYTGKALKPAAAVYDGELLLEQNVDYTITYKNNVNVNDALNSKTAPTVTVKGKGNYSGTKRASFAILKKDLADGDIDAVDIYAANSGKKNLPSPVVFWGDKKLSKNKDFTLEYPVDGIEGAYQAPGTYPVRINGKGSYTGSKTVYQVITNKTLITRASLSKIPGIAYTEEGMESGDLVITLKNGKKVLEKDVDYKILQKTIKGVGTHMITIAGMGEYAGTRTASLQVTGISLQKASIKGIFSKVYEQAEAESPGGIRQEYSIVAGGASGNALTEGRDYKLEYANNRKVGTASMVFTGMGAYTGTVKKSFRITPCQLLQEDVEITLPYGDAKGLVPYEKGGSKPVISLRHHGRLLNEGTDYKLSYKNNTKINDGGNSTKMPTVFVQGRGNYKGTVSQSFTIGKGSLKDSMVTVQDVVFRDKENAYKSKPVVTDGNGKRLSAGTDYNKTFEYQCYTDSTGMGISSDEIPPVGTIVHIKITGMGNYEGSTAEQTYRVVENSLSGASVTIKKQIYTGQPILLQKSDITVRLKGQTLPGETYEIVESSYLNNKGKGTAKVTIKGVGTAFGGTKTVSFTIQGKSIL